MSKYGLQRGTLKGELFIILSEQGNNGIKVSDLIRESKVCNNVETNVDYFTVIIIIVEKLCIKVQTTMLIHLILIFS